MMGSVGFTVLAGILVASSARAARADGPSCSRVTVDADASVENRWPELTERVRDAFEAREDVDRCARIVLTSRDGMIGVEVLLPDGRSARRSVPREEDVVSALEALLIVPEAAPAREEPSSPPATAPLAPSMAFAPAREAPQPALAPMLAQPSSHLRIELSAFTGARIGDGQASVGLGALSLLDVSGWLVGFAGRADRYEILGPAASTSAAARSSGALELALLGGHRWSFRAMALDLIAGPSVALGGTTSFSAQSPMGSMVSATASNTVPRLLVEARLAFAALSTVHTFVAVDGDFGPASSPDASLLPDARHLPTWTAGLALGATVGTQ